MAQSWATVRDLRSAGREVNHVRDVLDRQPAFEPFIARLRESSTATPPATLALDHTLGPDAVNSLAGHTAE